MRAREFHRTFVRGARRRDARQLARRAQPGARRCGRASRARHCGAGSGSPRRSTATRPSANAQPRCSQRGESMPSLRSRSNCERRLNSTTCSCHHWLAPSHSCVEAVEPRAVAQERAWSPAANRASRSKMPRCRRSGATTAVGSMRVQPCAVEPDLGPGMRLGLPHDEVAADGIPFATEIAGDDARRHARGAHHAWRTRRRSGRRSRACVSNSVVSTESMRGDAGLERVFETVVAEPVEHGARVFGVAAGARAHLERQRARARIAVGGQRGSRSGGPDRQRPVAAGLAGATPRRS